MERRARPRGMSGVASCFSPQPESVSSGFCGCGVYGFERRGIADRGRGTGGWYVMNQAEPLRRGYAATCIGKPLWWECERGRPGKARRRSWNFPLLFTTAVSLCTGENGASTSIGTSAGFERWWVGEAWCEWGVRGDMLARLLCGEEGSSSGTIAPALCLRLWVCARGGAR